MLLLNNAELLVALPPVQKARALSLFVDPSRFPLFYQRGGTLRIVCQSVWKTVACGAPSLHHSRLSDTVCSADMASAPSHLALSQTIAQHKPGPPRANRNLLPVSHAEPRRQKIQLKKREKKEECCPEPDEVWFRIDKNVIQLVVKQFVFPSGAVDI